MAVDKYKLNPIRQGTNLETQALPSAMIPGDDLPVKDANGIVTIPSADGTDLNPHLINTVYNGSADEVTLSVKLANQPNDEYITFTIPAGEWFAECRFIKIDEDNSVDFRVATVYFLYP